METRKKSIQDKFRDKLGLIVDSIKPGYGTTNDGNTARRFFNNPQISAEITGKYALHYTFIRIMLTFAFLQILYSLQK